MSGADAEPGIALSAALGLSGSGTITVTGIRASRLTVTLPGSRDIDASGSATRLDVSVDGSGDARLSCLVARNVDAVVRGSGAIFVTATQSLDAKLAVDAELAADAAGTRGGRREFHRTLLSRDGAVAAGPVGDLDLAGLSLG